MITVKVSALATVLGVCLAWPPLHPHAQTHKKVALIVAIGDYPESTGWWKLNTANDEKAVRSALQRQGFQADDIRTLADARATGPGIIAAFQELIRRAEPGAIAVFHYSGHGHRITDDNGDEPDGYDEVLVPIDAPHDPPRSYKGQKHVRDDELSLLVQQLRRAVGPTGDVIVSIDSCFSGSGARLALDEGAARVRGEMKPLGDPQGGKHGHDEAGGFDEPVLTAPSNAPLAPYVVLSASRYNELAWETSGSDNKAIGSLSFGLSAAMNRAGETTTYRALFDDIQRTMAAVVVNTPQIEGIRDREILAGKAITQEPFYTITSYDPGLRQARLAHGSLAGLFAGTQVAVHPAGTVTPKPENAIATGTVLIGNPTDSIVELDNVRDAQAVAAGWMFVTDQSFGTLKSTVRVDGPASAAWVAQVKPALIRQVFVQVGDQAPDFIVAMGTDGLVSLHAAGDFRLLLGPLDPNDPEFVRKIAKRVKDASANRYLRSLSTTAPGIKASVEILPCELACVDTDAGHRCDCARPLSSRLIRPPGGDLTLAYGDGFRIRLRNTGTEDAFISVLDLSPDGTISLLWPAFEHSGSDNVLSPGADFTVPRPLRVTEPAGIEVFKLIASRQQVDFRPITSQGFQKQGSRGPLDTLFADAFEGARAEPTVPVSTVHTQGITVRVVEKRIP